jgi:hypothetical protein
VRNRKPGRLDPFLFLYLGIISLEPTDDKSVGIILTDPKNEGQEFQTKHVGLLQNDS